MAPKGLGGTRSRTGRAAEDRGGSGAIGPPRAAAARLGADGLQGRRPRRGPPPSPPSPPTTPPDLVPLGAPASVDLGSGYAALLADGLRSLGLVLDPVIRAAIDRYAALVLGWSHRLNLTGTRDPVAFARDHVLDSLTAIPILRELGVRRFLDLGSGGGLPGIPLALGLPADDCLLVEARAKKAAVLERIVAALGLEGQIRVAGRRVEELARGGSECETWAAVTVRAVGPLAELVELALPLLAPGGVLVAWKAGRLAEELPAAERATAALGGSRPIVLEPGAAGSNLRHLLGQRRLVLVEKIRPTPTGFPRPPAARRRRSW